jgi:hypothetical protein
MKGFFAGIVAIFASIGSFIHGGQPATQPPTDSQVMTTPGANDQKDNKFPDEALSGTPRSRPSGAPPDGKNMQMVMGTISSVTTTSVTIDDPRNASTTIILNDATTYTNGTKSELAKDVRVAVKLKSTTDGSKVAESVELNPTVPSGAPNKPPGQQGPQGK